MSEPFVGQIQIFGFNFAPKGWAFCNGQTMSIAQNTALFSLLGTTYGGNGQTTFALPNLQSRVPIHFGQGPGLSPYALGQESGTENETLNVTNLPAHNHTVTFQVNSSEGGTNSPRRRLPGQGRSGAVCTDTKCERWCAAANRLDRRQPAVFDPAALPGAELLYRASGYFSVKKLTAR